MNKNHLKIVFILSQKQHNVLQRCVYLFFGGLRLLLATEVLAENLVKSHIVLRLIKKEEREEEETTSEGYEVQLPA